MIQPLGLAVSAAAVLGCAVPVVVSKNLVHSVFWLAATLLCTAVLFVFLGAPFLAGIQVVLYTGGVITLMLFGVMLTRREPNTKVPNASDRSLAALGTAVSLFAVLTWAIWNTPDLAGRALSTSSVSALAIGEIFLTDQLLAFEALSVLLLAAMLGAIVLVRKRDP